MAQKKFWRCMVCGDMHYGLEAPEICPTCHNPREKAEEIDRTEFLKTFEQT
jgi:rubrerythrin